MKGFYVIVKHDWEYDDEYYHRNSGYHARVAYTEEERELAIKDCAEMNAKLNSQVEKSDYNEGYGDEGDEDVEFFSVLFVPMHDKV